MNSIALCIPAYNAESYLPRLLDSAIRQTITFDEIFVYDDCSTDSTSEIAKSFGATVINGKVNIGCSKGKNILANLVQSEWIHFHDADDELLPNFTTLAIRWVNKVGPKSVILFNYEYRDNDTQKLIDTRIFDSKLIARDVIKVAILEQINPFCGLYHKNEFLKVGGYDIDPSVLYNEDSAMHLKLALEGFTFFVEPEISIINYRIKNSMSQANKLKCFEAQYNVMKKYSKLADSKYYRYFGSRLWEIAGLAASCLDYDLADKCIIQAKKLNVNHPIKWNLFKYACIVQPFWAIRLRETIIRLFKPQLR